MLVPGEFCQDNPTIAAACATFGDQIDGAHAGFGALLVCRFDALRHLGATGALGSVVGLLLALVLVPAWSRARGRPG